MIHRLGIHGHHYIILYLTSCSTIPRDARSKQCPQGSFQLFPVMRCVGEEEKKKRIHENFPSTERFDMERCAWLRAGRSSWRVRRAEAMTAFLGGLSGTRLPALSYLFPPLLLLTVIPSTYRYPHYAAPISHLLDQIGRHSIPCLGSESTEPAFPRDNPAPPFFPSASVMSTWIFTFPVSRPRNCR